MIFDNLFQSKKKKKASSLSSKVVKLENVVNILRSLKELSDLNGAFSLIFKGIDKDLGYKASLLLVDEKKRVLKAVDINSGTSFFVSKVLPKKLTEISVPLDYADPKMAGLAVQCYSSGEVITTRSMHDVVKPLISKQAADIIQKLIFVRYGIVVPVKSSGRVIAVLTAGSSKEILAEDIEILEAYADTAAAAISNSRLYSAAKEDARRLKEQNDQLKSIFDISQGVNSSLDTDQVTQIAVDSIAEAEGYVGAILSLVVDDTRLRVSAFTQSTLTLKAVSMLGIDIHEIAVGVNDPEFKDLITVKAVKNNEVFMGDSILSLTKGVLPDSIAHGVEKLLGSKTYVSVPVNSQGKVVGVISYFLNSKSESEIGEEDKSFMKTIAQVMSSALHNAHLYSAKEQALSDLVKARTELEQRLAELKEARARERDMMDIMGHELRTPLSIIKISLGALDIKAKRTPEHFNHEVYWPYSEKMHTAINRETQLLETMLTSTKIDARRLELLFEEVELTEIIKDSILGHQQEIEDKKIKLSLTGMEKPINAYVDKVRIAEVIDNLINNAVKYSIKGDIEVKAEEVGDMWKVSVKDSGIGIPKEAIPRLGEKFFRVRQYINDDGIEDEEGDDLTTVVRPGGTGLGLYVTFGLVKMMGGEVTVESELGKGSTFAFTVPRYTGQKATEGRIDSKDIFKRMGLSE